MNLLLRNVPNKVVVSKHVIQDRQQRLGERYTKEQLEALIKKYGKPSKKPPYGVHQGTEKSDLWIGVDTGKKALAFPLVKKRDRGETIFLATTVIARNSEISGVRKYWRRIRTRQTKLK